MSAVPHSNQEALESILSRVNELAVLPHAIYKILEISGNGNLAATELEKAIVVDPGFSTRLLAHANCAFYGLPKKVTSIKDAIMFLGFKQIRQMAMTVGFFDLFAGKNDKESLRRRTWWRSSIDTAIAAKWFSLETKAVPADEAYTIGLLHFVGKTLLDRAVSGAYDQVEALIASEMSVVGAETSVFGCDHIAVGQGACRKWGLPEPIVVPLSYLDPVRTDAPYAKQTAVVALGHTVSCATLAGPAAYPLPEWALEVLGLAPDDGQMWMERAMEYMTTSGRPSL